MRFSSTDIIKMLPHRAPFLLLDKVISCVPGESAVGIKNVAIAEPWFAGHFPTEPIFPGVLTLETIAQTIAIMYGANYLTQSNDQATANAAQHVGYLLSTNVKFLQPIVPGDTMVIKVKNKLKKQDMMSVDAVVEVNGNIVAKGNLGVSTKG